MRKIFTLSGLLLLSLVIATSTWAQTSYIEVKACIHDQFYTFHFANLKVNDDGSGRYHGTGRMDDPGNGVKWTARIDGKCFHYVHLRVINPIADGCVSGFTDSFHYDGNATAALFYGTTFYFDGSGSWTSYCSGSVFGTGSWAGTDCGHSLTGISGKAGMEPAKSNSNVISLLKVSPNPINSQATITYLIPQSGKVNITVYNSMQQAVKVLVNDFRNTGNYSAVWDAKTDNITSGIYRVVAIINNKTYTTTIQVAK